VAIYPVLMCVKKLVQKTQVKQKKGKTLRGIEPETSHSADLCLHYYAIKPSTAWPPTAWPPTA